MGAGQSGSRPLATRLSCCSDGSRQAPKSFSSKLLSTSHVPHGKFPVIFLVGLGREFLPRMEEAN